MGCKPDIMGLYRHPSKKFLNHHESVVMIRYDKELVWLLETLTSFLIVSLMIRWSSTCRDLDHGTQSEESQLCTKWPRFHNGNTCNMLQPSTKQISIQTFGAELPSCKCSFALVVAWKYRPAPDCLRFLWNLPRAMENCWASRDLQKKNTVSFWGKFCWIHLQTMICILEIWWKIEYVHSGRVPQCGQFWSPWMEIMKIMSM